MLTQGQIETELNLRNYWKESVYYPAPPIEPLIEPPIEPIVPPIEPPITPSIIPPITPPTGEGLIDRFGSLALVSIGVLFLLAIFPGQTEPSGGAE